MENIDFLQNIDDKNEFVNSVKERLDQLAFNELENQKKELANSFLQNEEE